MSRIQSHRSRLPCSPIGWKLCPTQDRSRQPESSWVSLSLPPLSAPMANLSQVPGKSWMSPSLSTCVSAPATLVREILLSTLSNLPSAVSPAWWFSYDDGLEPCSSDKGGTLSWDPPFRSDVSPSDGGLLHLLLIPRVAVPFVQFLGRPTCLFLSPGCLNVYSSFAWDARSSFSAQGAFYGEFPALL